MIQLDRALWFQTEPYANTQTLAGLYCRSVTGTLGGAPLSLRKPEIEQCQSWTHGRPDQPQHTGRRCIPLPSGQTTAKECHSTEQIYETECAIKINQNKFP